MKTRAALLVLGALAAPAAGAQTVPVRPAGDLSSFVGMPFDVPIVADWTARTDRLGSFALAVSWDTTMLRLIGATGGTFGAIQTNLTPAVLKMTGANPVGAAGMITLAGLRFTPLVAATTPVQLQVTELYTTGPTFAPVTAAATNALYCPARGYWGDPDLDRAASSRDALFALSAAVGLSVPPTADIGLADVDSDGAVKARDALIILSHAVGLDVSAFRILRVAVGSCGTDVTATYTVLPDTGTVLPGQELAFELRAAAGGAVRALPDVFWRSSNTNVLAVLQDGTALAVGPGTATVVGKSGLRDSATATIAVVARRTRHIVQASAVSAANRWGTAQFPFAHLFEAAQVAQDGDTVVVKPGRYVESAVFVRNVVVLGEPAGPDVPVIVGLCAFCDGILFLGTGTSEVVNVTFDSTFTAVFAPGPSLGPPAILRVRQVTIKNAVFGVDARNVVTVVDGATMTGDNTGTFATTGIFADGGGADTVVNSTIDDYDYAVVLDDTVAYAAGNTIRRSTTYGIVVFPFGTLGTQARLIGNTILQPTTFGIKVQGVDSLEVRGNVIEDVTAPAFIVPAGILVSNVSSRMRIVGNTLRRIHGLGIWIAQPDTATVFVDSNAVSAADSAAVQIDNGRLSMNGNNIQNNTRYGVTLTTSTGLPPHQVHGGAFTGNLLAAINAVFDSVNAQGNWWGNSTGACSSGPPLADCVLGRVDATGYLTSEPPGLPSLAPPRVTAAAPARAAPIRPAPSHDALLAERATVRAARTAAMNRLIALRARQDSLHRVEVERRFAAVRGGGTP